MSSGVIEEGEGGASIAARRTWSPPEIGRPAISAFAVATVVLWAVTAVVLTGLCLRFTMRLIGVRNDIPVPGLIYAATGPFVAPFGRFSPIPERFDIHAFEAASLLAAVAVVALALAVYAVLLILKQVRSNRRGASSA